MADTAIDLGSSASAPAAPAPSSAPAPSPTSPGPMGNLGSGGLVSTEGAFADLLKQDDAPSPSPVEAPKPAAAEPEKPQEAAATPEKAPEAAPAQKAPEAQAEPTEEILPIEGIRVETAQNGTKQFIADESAYSTLKSAYDTLRLGEQIMGQPLSQEVLEEARVARTDQALFETSLMGTTPQSAFEVFEYLDGLSEAAREVNEIRHDPLAVLAANLPSYLAQRSQRNPAFAPAYTAAANAFLRNTIDNTYSMTREAAQRAEAIKAQAAQAQTLEQRRAILASIPKADIDAMNRYHSAQHMDEWLFGDYDSNPNKAKATPHAAELAQINSARADLQRRQQQDAQSVWQKDVSEHNDSVENDVGDIISTTLKKAEPYYKGINEKALDGHKASMLQMLNNSIEQDENFQKDRANLLQRAMRSAPQPRKALLDQVKSLYTSKARILFNPYTNPEIRAILNQTARETAQSAQDVLRRAEKGAAQRFPSGGGTPDRPAVPAPSKATAAQNGRFDADELSKLIRAEL